MNVLKRLMLSAALLPLYAFAQTGNPESSKYALQAKAVYDPQALTVTVSWKPTTGFYSEVSAEIHGRPYSISERFPRAETLLAQFPNGTTSYVFTNLQPGIPFIYEIRRAVYPEMSSEFWVLQRSHLVTGFELPWRENRGGVLLVVEQSLRTALSPEVEQLKRDLLSDGFSSVRIVEQARMAVSPEVNTAAAGVARRAEIDSVRSKIKSWYLENTVQNQHVILLGRIPVVYSGAVLGPDGHQDHAGAWSIPLYYADMDETYTAASGPQPIWTDTQTNLQGPARNQNRPNDGKLDPYQALTSFELRVGRIDFANLGAAGEQQRYREYPARDHLYRNLSGNYANLQQEAITEDHLALHGSAMPCSSGWDAAASLFNNTGRAAFWFSVPVASPTYILMACSQGSSTSLAGSFTSTHALATPTAAPFIFLYGSYFPDWDIPNNLLVAALSGPPNNLALTAIPSFLPNINLSFLGIGESIGAAGAQRLERGGAELLGDPTLRVQRIFPPTNVRAVPEGANIRISWTASPGASTQGTLLGYHIFRASSPDGPFTRLTGVSLSATEPAGAPVSGLSFIHAGGAASANGNTHYYVVAMAKIITGTSSYYDSSQGVLTGVAGTTAAPSAPGSLRVQ